MARLPDGPEGVRRHEPVSLTDVPRTVLFLAGIDAAEQEGILLLRTGAARPVYGELRIRNRYTQVIRTGRWKLHRRFLFQPSNGELSGSPSLPQLLENCPHTVSDELYDMLADPSERTSLAGEPGCQEVRRALAGELERWWRSAGVPAGTEEFAEVEIDHRVVRRLRELGYIE